MLSSSQFIVFICLVCSGVLKPLFLDGYHLFLFFSAFIYVFWIGDYLSLYFFLCCNLLTSHVYIWQLITTMSCRFIWIEYKVFSTVFTTFKTNSNLSHFKNFAIKSVFRRIKFISIDYIQMFFDKFLSLWFFFRITIIYGWVIVGVKRWIKK